ncbi:MAG: mechanosensitive ion channel, partial [Firmicutes bacterium]|nr:mechanosensitive ion channel [Bacillota bacterium]
EYRAVLLGYPYAVAGPEEDPYTKKQQLGTAILLTNENGEADGFLLAVFDAEAMNGELKNESLEHTVSTFGVTEGNEAAVVRNEDGVFLAHTDPKKIGARAEYYITAEAYGEDYEGFTEYDGKSMYVSGVSTGGNSLLFMVPDRAFNKFGLAALLAMAVVLLIIRFLYCPKACELCAGAVREAAENHELKAEAASGEKHPLSVFTSGYALFLTVLAGIAMLSAFTMAWPAFTFLFGGFWSRGVHLFSLWAALFFTSVSLLGALLLRMALKGAEVRANPRVRTILKLADSSVSYAVGSFIIFGILYMFGVNTTALLASAGIVSIAVGMGAKDMAADILAGLFIATEDSLHMGDVVTIGSWKGRVTDLGIRTIEITDDSQNVKILNNSHVSDIVNMSRQKTACVLELPLERHAGMTAAEAILRKAVEAASEEMPELYGSLKLEGIYNISREGFTARLSYSCAEAARESVSRRLQSFLENQVRQDMEKASVT